LKLILIVCSGATIQLLAGAALAEPPPSPSYAVPLGLSYLALPALTAGAALAFPDANENEGAALAAGVIVLGLGAPAAVHALNGESKRAVVSPLGALGSAALGGLLGLAVGALVADAQCPAKSPSQEQDGCALGPVLLSTYAGAFVGYASWSIYDTFAHSSASRSSTPTVALAPKVSRAAAGLDVVGSF
jgi:hypothetical protein